MKPVLLIIGTVVGAVLVIWVTGQDNKLAKKATSSQSDAAVPVSPTPGPSSSAGKATAPPSKTARGSTRGRPTLVSDQFNAEARDHAWASPVEAEIRRRAKLLLDKLTGDTVAIAAVACKTNRCRFQVDGSNAKLFAKFVELLQGPSGFYGYAKQLALKNYRAAGKDGDAHVTVELSFKR